MPVASGVDLATRFLRTGRGSDRSRIEGRWAMTEVQAPRRGEGKLLERDYWAVLDEPRVGPAGVAALVARHFEELAPPTLVTFRRREGEVGDRPLEVGDELDVDIRLAGTFAVRVVHTDRNSLTLATLEGHPEAGRITFGAYRNRRGDVVFHIRSRAKAGSAMQLAGFLFAGDPMQTGTWGGFVNRLAASVGAGVVGAVHAEKRRTHEEPGDRSMDVPTYVAEGD
jgi:hypothetical protein